MWAASHYRYLHTLGVINIESLQRMRVDWRGELRWNAARRQDPLVGNSRRWYCRVATGSGWYSYRFAQARFCVRAYHRVVIYLRKRCLLLALRFDATVSLVLHVAHTASKHRTIPSHRREMCRGSGEGALQDADSLKSTPVAGPSPPASKGRVLEHFRGSSRAHVQTYRPMGRRGSAAARQEKKNHISARW